MPKVPTHYSVLSEKRRAELIVGMIEDYLQDTGDLPMTEDADEGAIFIEEADVLEEIILLTTADLEPIEEVEDEEFKARLV